VGDEVVVVNEGLTFSTCTGAFWFFGLKDKKHNKLFQRDTKGQIIGVSRHKDRTTVIYALRDSNGNECVIGEEGIKLAGIDKQEWLDAASRLFDSWMKISGGYVPKGGEMSFSPSIYKEEDDLTYSTWHKFIDSLLMSPLS
jgi:hypothetical protein